MKLGSAFSKMIAGTRVVGPSRSAAGAMRFGWLALRNSSVGEVRTRIDGLSFQFRYPQDLMPTLVVFRELMEPEYELVRRVLRSDSVFVDVGAAIGTYSLVAAKRMPEGWVHSFEPQAASADLLECNARENGLAGRVNVNRCALSERSGFGAILPSARSFLAKLSDVHDVSADSDVRVTTLDEYALERGIDHIDVLKIDVEGHEPEVLAGAERLLREGRMSVLILEAGPASLQLYRMLQARGFRAFMFRQAPCELVEVAVENVADGSARLSPFHSNVVFILEKRVAEIAGAIRAEVKGGSAREDAGR